MNNDFIFNKIKTELLSKYEQDKHVVNFLNSYKNIEPDFWESAEKPAEFVIYQDTDSDYIIIPEQPSTPEEIGELALSTGSDINKSMELPNRFFLVKCNVDHNNHYYVDFKTEMAANAIQFVGVKKLYAYNKIFELKKTGPVYYDGGKIVYTGLPLKKVDVSQLIKDFMYDLLLLGLVPESKNKNEIKKQLYLITQKYSKKNDECISNLNIEYIGRPKKATNQPYVINSVNLFNTIMTNNEINQGESVYLLPIIITKQLKNKVVLTKNSLISHTDTLSNIAIPFDDCDKQELKEKLDEFGIILNNQFTTDKFPKIYYSGNKGKTIILKLINNIKRKYKI